MHTTFTPIALGRRGKPLTQPAHNFFAATSSHHPACSYCQPFDCPCRLFVFVFLLFAGDFAGGFEAHFAGLLRCRADERRVCPCRPEQSGCVLRCGHKCDNLVRECFVRGAEYKTQDIATMFVTPPSCAGTPHPSDMTSKCCRRVDCTDVATD